MLESTPLDQNPPVRPEELLQAASEALKKQWPGMSLRAVAARLKISPSYWSKILRGEKPLPESLLQQVVTVLRMDALQIAQLQQTLLKAYENAQLSPATGLRTLRDLSSPIDDYRSLGREDSWLLEEWYHLPILTYMTLMPEIEKTPEEIARRMALPLARVRETLQRLEQHGFIRVNAEQRLESTDRKVRFPTDRSLPIVRRYHRSVIQKASEQLSVDPSAKTFESRQISSVCFSGASEKMREARMILEEAMYRVANLMADAPGSDEIYQLNLQLFPLTKP